MGAALQTSWMVCAYHDVVRIDILYHIYRQAGWYTHIMMYVFISLINSLWYLYVVVCISRGNSDWYVLYVVIN